MTARPEIPAKTAKLCASDSHFCVNLRTFKVCVNYSKNQIGIIESRQEGGYGLERVL